MSTEFEKDAVKLLVNHAFPYESVSVENLKTREITWPDILIPSKNVVVEVKQILIEAELTRSALWISTIKRIKKQMDLLEWAGFFVVHGSFMNFHWKRDKELLKEYVRKLHGIIINPSNFEEKNHIRLQIIPEMWASVQKVADEGKNLEFSATSDIQYVDQRVRDAKASIDSTIQRANLQLDTYRQQFSGTQAWLLLIIQDYRLWSREDVLREYIEGCSNTIDQIWCLKHNRNTCEAWGWARLK